MSDNLYIHLCNQHLNHNMNYLHQPKMFSCASLLSVSLILFPATAELFYLCKFT